MLVSNSNDRAAKAFSSILVNLLLVSSALYLLGSGARHSIIWICIRTASAQSTNSSSHTTMYPMGRTKVHIEMASRSFPLMIRLGYQYSLWMTRNDTSKSGINRDTLK